jgi:RNA polymerase sporulation-specific sigma factor
MIGLYKAIRDYDEDKLSSFKNFADICITRQIITAVKAATRYKHTPLNTYVSLNLPIFEQNDSRTVEDMISSNVPTASNPEDIFIIKENYTRIENKLYKLLSDFEYKVFEKYISGKSYQEIANELGKTMKSVDNALQRIKKKIERCLDKND